MLQKNNILQRIITIVISVIILLLVIGVIACSKAGTTIEGAFKYHGEAVPDIAVTLKTPEGGPVQQTKTDIDGFFKFSEVLPGEYAIVIDKSLEGKICRFFSYISIEKNTSETIMANLDIQEELDVGFGLLSSEWQYDCREP